MRKAIVSKYGNNRRRSDAFANSLFNRKFAKSCVKNNLSRNSPEYNSVIYNGNQRYTTSKGLIIPCEQFGKEDEISNTIV